MTELSRISQTCYGTIDPSLLSLFSERWHVETNSFHLPFGEMIITLDNVSRLLHLPTHGCLLKHSIISRNDASEMLVDNIKLAPKEATDKCHKTISTHVRFKWLDDQYRNQLTLTQLSEDEPIREVHKTNVLRAYLLCLVGTTLFIYESAT